ncbi:MAG: 4-oxalocrotonate tautomerase [Pseudomonadota bacterium]|nr:4-oxalocrotonate tautomerase [Pseudomonadota bacterium]
MPVVVFSLPASLLDEDRGRQLTVQACAALARILDAPPERVRASVTALPDWAVCAGQSAAAAPFYQFYVLQDRPAEQVAALHQAFTGLLVTVCGAERGLIRGVCLRIAPDDWAIAGLPASEIRRAELAARGA